MQTINKLIHYTILLLQGCFTGLLLGQAVNLFSIREPVPWIRAVAFGAILLLLLFLYKKEQLQQYLLRYFSFYRVHFAALIICGFPLLLLLLPLTFQFEQAGGSIYSWQAGALLALFLLLAENLLLQLDLLRKVSADLLQLKQSGGWQNYAAWGLALAFAALLSRWLFEPAAGLHGIILHTLYPGALLFLLLLGIKLAQINLFAAGSRDYAGKTALADEDSNLLHKVQQNQLYLEQHLKRVLLSLEASERPLVYQKIRQVPLIDKIETLESLQQEHLRDDEELARTLKFLRKLSNKVNTGNAAELVDRLDSVIEVKACIRTVIKEGSPMVVQKLLNDSRPEVKKAAMLATVYYQEPGFIPALVNLLKDHEYAFTAREALYALGEQCIPFLRSAKYRNKGNIFFIEQCLELVESYKSEEARDFLVEVFNEPQKRFQYKAALALVRNNYTLSSLQKTQLLQLVESLIAAIAMQREVRCALQDSASALYTALQEEEKEKRALVTGLLQAFLPAKILPLLEDTGEGAHDRSPFTLFALVDLYFPLVLRNSCKILLGSGSNENIAPRLQAEYLHEQVCFNYSSRQEAVRQILQMDYSQIGSWLRVCALRQLAEIPGQQPSLQYFAEVFNENQLLQEVAAELLYDLSYDYYYLYMQRLPTERAKVLKYKIDAYKSQANSGSASAGNLLYNQILFLHSLPLFNAYSCESLAEKIKLFHPITLEESTGTITADSYKSNGYWIVYQGAFKLYHQGAIILAATKGDIIDMSFLAEAEKHKVNIQAEGEIKIFFVEYNTVNKLYLKSVYFNKHVLRPVLAHALTLPVA